MSPRVDLACSNGLSPPSGLVGILIKELLADPEARSQLASVLAPFVEKPASSPVAEGWLDSAGAAKYLGISIGSLHKLTAARRVPFEQDCRGGKLWFERPALDAHRRGESFHIPSIEALPGRATSAA